MCKAEASILKPWKVFLYFNAPHILDIFMIQRENHDTIEILEDNSVLW